MKNWRKVVAGTCASLLMAAALCTAAQAADVVVTDGGAFFCESIGFLEIGFDESETHKRDDLLKIVYVEPGRAPFVSEVGDDFKSIQKAVDGLFQPVYMDDGTVLVCNEEAKLKEMPGNRHVGDSIIAGPFFMVGDSDEGFRSLTDAETEKYMTQFSRPITPSGRMRQSVRRT